MKKLIQILVVATLMMAVNSFTTKAQIIEDSVVMDPQYANDIYYSFENGEVLSVDRTNWDIAFYTSAWSAGIITNDGNSVELYVYPNGDTASWETIDTTGLFTWTPYYNSTIEWEDGAFNRTSSGHPDYGWGVYNTITHSIVGDSIYVLKFVDGSTKKLWIEQKISTQNTYEFKYANLDGSDEVSETLDCSAYATKNFIYYSLQNQLVVDREPETESWDVVFTKYIVILEEGSPYPVTGVLNNLDVAANRFDMVAPDFSDWSSSPFDSIRCPIGHDWKDFDMSVFAYVIQDSVAFFVQNRNQDVFKLVFEAFDYTVGKVVFNKSVVSLSSIEQTPAMAGFSLAPNPASNYVSVFTGSENTPEEVVITDLSGREVYRQNFELSGQNINLEKFNPGMYVVILRYGNALATQKLLIR